MGSELIVCYQLLSAFQRTFTRTSWSVSLISPQGAGTWHSCGLAVAMICEVAARLPKSTWPPGNRSPPPTAGGPAAASSSPLSAGIYTARWSNFLNIHMCVVINMEISAGFRLFE